MSSAPHPGPKRVLWVLGITVAGMLLVLITRQHATRGQKPAARPVSRQEDAKDAKADILIHKVRHTATKNGKPQMHIDADTARYEIAKNLAYLDRIQVVFFLDNDEKAYLTAEKGVLNTSSYELEASGDVVVQNAYYRLEAETLHYSNERRTIWTRAPVRLAGVVFHVAARSMQYHLDTQQTILDGQVEGTILENATL